MLKRPMEFGFQQRVRRDLHKLSGILQLLIFRK